MNNNSNKGKRGAGTPTKLQSLNKDNRSQSPSLRGAKNSVLPGIKNGKNTSDTKADLVKQFAQLLHGSYTELPPKTPKEVRLFLSSTFTDMKVERNTLAKKCYPELKDFCQTNYGIDFSVVDMRWGVTDEASNDHSTEELCLNEIKTCKQVGLGPTFVTMVGDRYGYRPIPKYISESEYSIIIKHANEKEDKSIIEKWYKKDMNAVPPHYLLQTIKTYIPNYGETSESKTEWNQTFAALTDGLRKAIDNAHTAKEITDERKHAYNMSVTESEIIEGIKNTKDPADHCLGFIRTFMGLDDDALNVDNSAATRHTDVLTNNGKKILDMEVVNYKTLLKDKTMTAILPKSRLRKYEPLLWYKDGVSEENHGKYIDSLSTDFTNNIKELVQNDKKNTDQTMINKKFKSDYDEIVHHLYFVHTKCETFVGRNDVLEDVKKYLADDKHNTPLVLHAESGGGKTSVMAKIFDQLPLWFGDSTCRMIRFLGTSPLSSNIHDVLQSVAYQLADITGEILQPSSCKTMKSTLSFFPRFLRTLMRNRSGKVVMLLDSIDQLSSDYDAHKMKWLNMELPKNFHIIISTLPDLHNILDNCKKRGISAKSMIEVKSLEADTGKLVINSHLKRQKRCLQPDQEKLILDAFEKVQNVLFLKLALDKAMGWQSTTALTGLDEVIGSSIKESIKQIFSNLENKFGHLLVSRSLGYITAGNGGLTTVEIEDILSIDNDVLIDVYQYHPPPVPGVVRIPPLLWVRIQNDIKEYLVEHSTHGKTTLFWYHRQFIETARETYVNGKEGISLHRNLARLYQADNGIKEDITLSRLRKPHTVTAADRQVSKQPVIASNVRALVCIPYHLQQTGDLHQLKTSSLFKLKLILKKIESLGLESFLDDIEKAFKLLGNNNTPDLDLEILQSCFLDINSEEKNPKVIVGEIIARIPVVSWLPYGRDLVRQCFDYLSEVSSGIVTPIHSSLYNKADLMMKRDHVEAFLYHYGDHIGVKTLPGFKRFYSKNTIFSLLDISGKSPTEVYSKDCPLYLLKERNVISSESYIKVKINQSKATEPAKLQYNHHSRKLDHRNDKVPSIHVGNCSNIVTPLVGRDESLLNLQLTVSESSSRGLYLTLIFGKNFVFNRSLVEKLSQDKDSQCLLKIRGSNEPAAKGLTKNVQEIAVGINPEVLFACHLEFINKLLLIVQSSTDNEFQIRFSIFDQQSFKLQTLMIWGEVIIKKWMLMKDETRYSIACNQKNGKLTIVTMNTQEWTSKQTVIALKEEEKLIDISYSGIGEHKCYVLTNSALHCADLDSQSEINTIFNDYSDATYLTVEDDGEYLYIGTSSGRIDCIKVLGWEYLGFVDLGCGSINKIVLSSSDINIVAHGSNNQLVTMSQRHFANQCKANREVKTRKQQNQGLILDFYLEAKLLMFVSKGDNTELVSFEEGKLKVWPLNSLQPKLVSYGQQHQDFCPSKVIYNSMLNKTKSLLTTEKTAMILDTEKYGMSTIGKLEGDAILACTQGDEGFFILTSEKETSLMLNVLPYNSSDVTKVIKLKEQMKATNVEIKVTASQKYLAIKMECPEKELDIISKTIAKMSAVDLGGTSKLYAMDLTSQTGALSPCYRQLSKLLLLADEFDVYKEHTILLGVYKEIHQWDLSTGKAMPHLIKGTKTPMFFTANLKNGNVDSEGENNSSHFSCVKTSHKGKDCQIVSVGSKEGYINIYKGGGQVVYNGQSKGAKEDKPKINHMWISPDSSWIATVCDARILRVWSAKGKSGQISQIQLDVVVTQGFVDESSTHIALLGDRNDLGSKILIFKVSL